MKYSKQEKLGIGLFLLGAVFLIITTYVGITKPALWSDELYTMYAIGLDFNGLVSMTIGDVHPIGYYVFLKAFVKFFTALGYSNTTILAKIFSMIPFYLLGVLTFFKIRRDWGWLTAGIFFLAVTSMPRMMIFAVEVRMYSWGLFFITASLIYVLDIIKKPSKKSWAILTLLTVCSIWTHHFCTICSMILYLILILKDKTQLKNWIISVAVCAVSYIPEAAIAVSKLISTTTEGFWIDPISLSTLISYVYFTISPAREFVFGNELIGPTVLGSVFLIAIIYLLYNSHERTGYLSIFAFLLVPVIGVVVSLATHPIFHPRYMVPAMGMLWFGFSILLADAYENKKVFIPVLMVVLLVSVVGCVDFIELQNEDFSDAQTESGELNRVLDSGNIVYVTRNYTKYIFSYYAPHNTYITFKHDTAIRINESLNTPEIKSMIENGSRIFVVTDNPPEEIESVTGHNLTGYPMQHTITGFKAKTYEITGLAKNMIF